MSNDLISLTATAAVRLIHDGNLRREALMDACLDRIESHEPTVQAFAHFDPAQARAAATKPSPLQGIPIGAKNVLNTSDMPSQYGSPIWASWKPRAASAPFAWADAAGGVIISKFVTTELR
jgi:Asp-tRNA(Asn)/Glu-tRNA(Gln) amidotransferase A subunit family amidase